MLQSSSRDFLHLVAPNSVAAAAITVAVFVIFAIVYILTGVGNIIWISLQSTRSDIASKYDCPRIIQLILQFCAGFLYIVGDNIAPILRNYSDPLNCNTTCIEVAVSVGEGFLAVILPLYFFILILRWVDAINKEHEKRIPIPPLDALRLAVFAHEFDVVFTAVQRQFPGACTTPYHIVVWVIWLVYVSTLTFVTFSTFNIFVICDPKLKVDDEKVRHNCAIVTSSNVHLVIVILLIAAYLLADNNVPLSCSGDGNVVNGVRVALWILCVPICSYMAVIWLWKLYHSKDGWELADDGEFLAFYSGKCQTTTFQFSIEKETETNANKEKE